MRRVKGPIRIYLAFDYLSVFAVNLSFLYELIDIGKNMKNMHLTQDFNSFDFGNITKPSLRLMMGPLIQDVNQAFVSLRKCFLLLIVNDARALLCDAFNFKTYIKMKKVIIRYLYLVAYWLTFHCLHFIAVTITIVYMFKDDYWIFYFKLRGFAMTIAKLSLRTIFSVILVIRGSIHSFEMSKSLKEMDQNEFTKNKHCDSLYKMSVAFTVLVATSVPVELAHGVILLGKPGINQEFYIMMTKAFYETMSSIIIMIIFMLSFPRMRPRRIEQNQNE